MRLFLDNISVSFGENEVVEEFQKGYKYKDSVILYSMVKVAN